MIEERKAKGYMKKEASDSRHMAGGEEHIDSSNFSFQ